MENKFVSPYLMWLLAGSGAALLLLIVPSYQLLPRGWASTFAFALIFQLWLGFFALSLWQNRRAAQSVAEVKSLITSGTYSIVRHPIYFADILLSWGVFIFFSNLIALLSAAWITFVLYSWAGFEEDALRQKFGRKYTEYAKKVPKFIPRI